MKAFADEPPDLVKLNALGQSFEGRDVHVVTVTNFHTGPAEDKPALWIDGNIHASEVSPSTACLYLIDMLVKNYGERDDVTRALDTRALYIAPRVNPDGAELALADTPKIIRSSTRPYPYDETPIDGLRQEDIDGDGRLLSMRVRDANGPWKVSEKEPRLLVRRDPTETGGTYYRVLPEGLLDDYDGVTLTVQAKKEGLDLNRNFPANWRNQAEQAGAGPYPTSEPEVKNLVDFVAKHPNITGGITFHTYGGVLLRPFSGQSDDEFAAEDLWTYQKIGGEGYRVDRLPARERVSRLQVPPQRNHHRGVRRLAGRGLGRVRLDGRNLEPAAAGGHQRLQVHRLVPRAQFRRRPQAVEVERRNLGGQGLRGLVRF